MGQGESARRVQDLFLAGDREGAAAALSAEFIDAAAICCRPASWTSGWRRSRRPAWTRCLRCPSETGLRWWRPWPPRRGARLGPWKRPAQRAPGRRDRRLAAQGPVPGGRVRGGAAHQAARDGACAGVRRGVQPRRAGQGGVLRAARPDRRAAVLDVAHRTTTGSAWSWRTAPRWCWPAVATTTPAAPPPRRRSASGPPACAWPARASCSPRSSGCAASCTRRGCSSPQKALHRPALPRAIGVVTGERGKARDDVLAGLRRRGWAGRLVWAFAPVQDRRAAPPITRALQDLAAVGEVDAIVVARGGGSVMDLMAFSDETLCRTVAMLPVPVIASVGHHTDRTLIDDVASVSCSTPTHAAESAVRLHCGDARRAAAAAAGRLERGGRRAVVERARRLTALSRAPAEHLASERRRMHQRVRELRAAGGRQVEDETAVTRRRLLVLRRQSERLGAASGREDAAGRARGRASCAARRAPLSRAARATSSGCRWRWRPTTPSARWNAAMRSWRRPDGAALDHAPAAAREESGVWLRFADGRVGAHIDPEEEDRDRRTPQLRGRPPRGSRRSSSAWTPARRACARRWTSCARAASWWTGARASSRPWARAWRSCGWTSWWRASSAAAPEPGGAALAGLLRGRRPARPPPPRAGCWRSSGASRTAGSPRPDCPSG